MSKPGDEDFQTQRLQAHVRQMVAETYVHAGYTQTSTSLIERVVSDYHTIYKRTESKVDLASYAKALLILSRARIQSGLWESSLSNLALAEAAFSAAHVPMDPEIYRQRAEICLAKDLDEDAKALYRRAFDSFPAHREHLGFGGSAHARFDAGKRPLAVISADFEAALEALEAAEAWPEGDIHRAINLNAAIATAQLSDSSEAKNFPNQYIKNAVAASDGYGQQMTRAMLLGLTPRIPTEVRKAWVRFVLRYNAYRSR
jgi:tetratricopeptide (TPR) repeat protein